MEHFNEAKALYRRMLEISQRTRGAEDEMTLTATGGLAAILSLREYSEAVALSGSWRSVPDEGAGRPCDPPGDQRRGGFPHERGQTRGGRAATREVVEIESKNQPDDPITLNSTINYADLLSRLSRASEASEWAGLLDGRPPPGPHVEASEEGVGARRYAIVIGNHKEDSRRPATAYRLLKRAGTGVRARTTCGHWTT